MPVQKWPGINLFSGFAGPETCVLNRKFWAAGICYKVHQSLFLGITIIVQRSSLISRSRTTRQIMFGRHKSHI